MAKTIFSFDKNCDLVVKSDGVYRRGKAFKFSGIDLVLKNDDNRLPIFFDKTTGEELPKWAVQVCYQLEFEASVDAWEDYLYNWKPSLEWKEIDYIELGR